MLISWKLASRAALIGSARVLVREPFEYGEKNDLEVKPQRDVFDVEQVVRDALLHLVKGVGFTAKAVDLCPAGDAGFDFMASHVTRHQLFVVLVVLHGMWARADDRHSALQHIEELRQFVQTGTPQKGTLGCDAGVVSSGLRDLKIGLPVLHHAAKFVHRDFFAVPAVALLFEQHWAG